jgi:hypothetical protein
MIKSLCTDKGCRQKIRILEWLLYNQKEATAKQLSEVLWQRYNAYIYKYLNDLKDAGLVDRRKRRWYIPSDKRRELQTAFDPPLLKVYLAGASTALEALRSFPGIPFLLSAGLYWSGDKFRFEGDLSFASEIFMDSGAQQFFTKFKSSVYPYTPAEYLNFASRIGADLIATLDLPLDILTPRGLSVTKGIRKTVEYGVQIFAYAEKKNLTEKIVPVLQGYDDVNQWLESLDQYLAHGIKAKVWGIGSLCMAKSKRLVRSVVNSVAKRLKDSRIHVFGLALDSVREVYKNIDSFDTAAWVYWAKMDGVVFVWDSINRRFIHLQARDGKRYDTLSLMRANIDAIFSMVRHLNNLKCFSTAKRQYSVVKSTDSRNFL